MKNVSSSNKIGSLIYLNQKILTFILDLITIFITHLITKILQEKHIFIIMIAGSTII